MKQIIITIFLSLLLACNSKTNDKMETSYPTPQNVTSQQHNNIKLYNIDIIDILPHNSNYYTQGLIFYNGTLYEGTGGEGHSILVKYKKDNYSIDKIINLDNNIFGEGITIFNSKVYQISWLNQTCFVYDANTLNKQTKDLFYQGEGWGLTNNDSFLIMSDGSATIKFFDTNFRFIKSITIKKDGQPIRYINELELVDTLLYANIYMRDLIIIANINNGEIVGQIDISSLRKHLHNNPTQEVSNGIAYDIKNDIFFLTGKNWNKLFVVKFNEKE